YWCLRVLSHRQGRSRAVVSISRLTRRAKTGSEGGESSVLAGRNYLDCTDGYSLRYSSQRLLRSSQHKRLLVELFSLRWRSRGCDGSWQQHRPFTLLGPWKL